MKKAFIRISILLLIALSALSLLLFPEKKIVEQIKVEEWIVPIYAVDAMGKSVTDLNNNDIELYVNDLRIEKFNFIKRKFFSNEKRGSKWFKTNKEEKIIVLVFDTALTRSHSIMKSKAIADQLVEKSGNDTKFILFKIRGFHGLSYLGGPSNNKKRIRNIIKKKVLARENERSVSSGVDDSEGEKTKYQHDERMFFLMEQTKYLSRKSRHYSSSFKDLYYATTNILGTKFIYLFSEGISPASYRRGDVHAGKMAGSLLRSGAVLFFINPSGGRGSDPESGEEFLQVLSSLSGGKYLTGDTKSIGDKIDNVHNGYYELTFQSPGKMKDRMLRIDVRSKRKLVNIHTIRNLEKSKEYLGLNDFEKNLVVMNMISKNPIFKLPVDVEDAGILKEENSRGNTVFHVSIPEHFRNTSLDLYKINMPLAGRSKPKIQKMMIKIPGKVLKIPILKKMGFTEHFALVNHQMGLALIKGVEKKAIRFNSASLENGILDFELGEFKYKTMKGKKVALLRITIKIVTQEGVEVKSDSKEITAVKKSTRLRIPLRLKKTGNYSVLIIAEDMISGDEVNKVVEARL